MKSKCFNDFEKKFCKTHKKLMEWSKIIKSKIKDADLQSWVGCIIYWDFSNKKKYGLSEFEKEFVDNYNPNHEFSESDLFSALELIGYKRRAT